MKSYDPLTQDPIAREKEVLAFWKETDAFAASLALRVDRPRFVFYEGPPTANGKPHIGHMMPRVYKDLFPRYKTMRGFLVDRKGGWDTHGLPVELEVEKEIGVNSKPEIEAYGVERFVERCKDSVWRYKAEWERMIERMGFWIDLESAYVTYTDEYIESVWWMLAQMFNRGLLYRGHKVLPYCARCGTGLSSHEVAQGYKRVEDPSLSVRMRIVSDENSVYKLEAPNATSLLTWTTTPWTLPANTALAIAAPSIYVEVEQNGERLILARARQHEALDGDFRVLREFEGKDLIGLVYEPLYALLDDERAYRTYAADFVNMEEGTGIVHTAPAFGEDDYQFGLDHDLPLLHPVDLAGAFTDAFPLAAGRFVKDADETIVNDLRSRGLLYRFAPYEHDYPFCWRCDTPLLYYAMDSWFVRTTAVKDEIIANNRRIRWYPEHVGEGRLGDFLANLKDWALSRDRYWGTPLNLWTCAGCEKTVAVESREMLVDLALDQDLARTVELHRPYVDAVELRCPDCAGTMRRVSNVIDAWFDSGSMHTAQWHYPFENEERFKENFPADFICEAMEQTRGWFYTLLATSTIIHGDLCFRNCIATGLGLDGDGVKMSKSKGNVVDPWSVIDQYGADCLRWYLYSSSAPWKSKRLGEADIKEPLYRFLDTLRNAYGFFALYASIDGYDPAARPAGDSASTVIDRWIRSRLATAVATVTKALDAYDVILATEAIEGFVSDLSNWYIRSSRRRFWRGGMEGDKAAAYDTLWQVLMTLTKLVAPFVPFIAEAIYRRLRTPADPESVHLCDYPALDEASIDEDLEAEMRLALRIVSLGHQARNRAQEKVRQPLRRLLAQVDGEIAEIVLSEETRVLVEAELNVEVLEQVASLEAFFEEVPVPDYRAIGPRLGARGQRVAAWIEEQSAANLRELLRHGAANVEIDGESVTLEPDDVDFRGAVPDAHVLVEEGGLRVLLDATLDERLRTKGRVRELVHAIQVLRKKAGFEVSDRIILGCSGNAEIVAIVDEHQDQIVSEVLAVELRTDAAWDAEFRSTVTLDLGSLEVALARASQA